MALVKNILQNQIETAFKAVVATVNPDDSGQSDDIITQLSIELTEAIDAYIRSATVNTTVTTTVAGGSVTGGPVTGAGTGAGVGTLS
jgi:hypothetical protein